MATIVVDMNESDNARPLLTSEGASSAYLIVAIDTVVIGKVYDHHDSENLFNKGNDKVIMSCYNLISKRKLKILKFLHLNSLI